MPLPASMGPLMARLALTNPQQLASIAAAKGLMPPPIPGGPPQNVDLMTQAPQPATPQVQPGDMPGAPAADPFAALSQVQAPQAPQPLPPVGVPMGSGQMNVQALIQALLAGNQGGGMPPSLGASIMGG